MVVELRAQLHVLLDGGLVEHELLLQRLDLRFSFAFCDLAFVRPCTQPIVSRKGRETRSAAISKGRRIPAAVPWTPSSALERKETVIRTRERTTRLPTTIRRLRALERLEG